MRLRAATPADAPAVRHLLAGAGLDDDVAALLGPALVVAIDDERGGALAGVAAIEPFGSTALLRSVAVARDHRGHGVGAALVADRLAWAARAGADRVVLLTTGAAAWFERLGFERVERRSLPEALRSHPQLTTACPASADVLAIRVARPAGAERRAPGTPRGAAWAWLVVAALAAAWPAPTRAAGGDIERLAAVARAESRAMPLLEELTTRFGPRLSGSRSHDAAVAWARDVMERHGAVNVRLERAGTLPVGFQRGRESGAMIAPRRRPLRFATPAWSAATRGPVRGPALHAGIAIDDPSALPAGVAGAWVLVDADEPSDPRERAALLDALAGSRAAGVVHRVPDGPILVQGDVPASREAVPTVPVVLMADSDWSAIARELEVGTRVELELDLAHELPGPRVLEQPIGEIRGSDRADEIVLVAAHVDSWDAAVGATDDGAGVAATLEAVRLLVTSGARPRRTIRFALFTGEEQGLIGSRAYVRDHAAELDRHVAVLVMDAGGRAISGIAAPPWLRRALAPLRGLDPARPFVARRAGRPRAGSAPACAPPQCASPGATTCAPSQAACASSHAGCAPPAGCASGAACAGAAGGCAGDHVPFQEAGVPAYPWDQAEDPASYAATHHTDRDVLAAVDAADLEHSARVIAMAALLAADAPPRR